MYDVIPIKQLIVDIQENGIIRAPNGRLIARLEREIEFDSEHLKYPEGYHITTPRLKKLLTEDDDTVMKHAFEQYLESLNLGDITAGERVDLYIPFVTGWKARIEYTKQVYKEVVT